MLDYTSKPEIESIFSAAGVRWRIDDDRDNQASSPELTFLTDVVQDASQYVQMQLQRWYSDAQCAASMWVRRQASLYAAHLLSLRRGNPGQFRDAVTALQATFDKIQMGWLRVPDIVPAENLGPAMSSYVVDQRWGLRQIRVVEPASSGDSLPSPDLYDPFTGGYYY